MAAIRTLKAMPSHQTRYPPAERRDPRGGESIPLSTSHPGLSFGTPQRVRADLGGNYSINPMNGLYPSKAQSVVIRLCYVGDLRSLEVISDTEYPPFILDEKRSLVIKFDLGNCTALTATDIKTRDPTNNCSTHRSHPLAPPPLCPEPQECIATTNIPPNPEVTHGEYVYLIHRQKVVSMHYSKDRALSEIQAIDANVQRAAGMLGLHDISRELADGLVDSARRKLRFASDPTDEVLTNWHYEELNYSAFVAPPDEALLEKCGLAESDADSQSEAEDGMHEARKICRDMWARTYGPGGGGSIQRMKFSTGVNRKGGANVGGTGRAFIDKNLFTTYTFNPPPHLTQNLEDDEDPVIQFGISLTALLECLQIFDEGDAGGGGGKWRGGGGRAGGGGGDSWSGGAAGLPTTTTCELTTHLSTPLLDIPSNANPENHPKILPSSSSLLVVSTSPTPPHFTLPSTSPLGTTIVEFSNDGALLETFTVSRRAKDVYRFALVRHARGAMAAATKFMVEREGRVSFVDFRFLRAGDREGGGGGRGDSAEEEEEDKDDSE
ncbi:hypothetical protein B9Z19DRAFT_1135206 [Tuber borchii]|uniref:Uncharacterized protein n=1 Tax=Tuber borchii TaxID=42251 RepID=A0A2T6ZD29_TUBBO|nr:hypothetical protein B9Z19DRAFT_1135206 [Tuber borchii]